MKLIDWGLNKLVGEIKVSPSLCVRASSPQASCSLCADICPERGIRLTEEGPLVQSCRACGRCVRDCPERVFTLDAFLVADYVNKKDRIVIGCTHDPGEARVDGRISCFTQLEPEWLAPLLGKMDQLVLYVDQEACATCVNDWSPESLTVRLDRLAIPHRDRLVIIRDPAALNQFFDRKRSRRAFIADGFQYFQETGKKEWQLQLARYVAQDGERRLPRRSLLIKPFQEAEDLPLDQELPYRSLGATACQFCGACSQVCPHGALRLDEAEGEAHLLHAPVLCSQCHLCQDLCPVDGLHWQAPLKIEDIAAPAWRSLAAVRGQVCKHCGEIFHELPLQDPPICRFCRARQRPGQV
ncbi:4Fe-4S dicluster domain-containing protein [Peptococcus simiae]|uniref:4Fe-4S dicluster domain-containing protein n=1 Tax=Peptococcus simiae TaxID=1643805 RepID=A0ABW9GWT2_9FIRM